VNTSPGWKGEGWYRFVKPAGIKIPEKSPASNKCGTLKTGWLNGKHPVITGESKKVQYCFHWSYDECRWSFNGRVTNCGGYYVYYLPATNFCTFRYCATNDP